MNVKYFFSIISLFSLLIIQDNFSEAQTISPTTKQSAVLITGGTVHVGNGVVFENGIVAFENGKLTIVGDLSSVRVDRTRFEEVIDATGKHVYPGFILPLTTLGLRELDAVRASLDYEETGRLNPHVRALVAYNTDSDIIPTIRSNGILTAQVVMEGGLVSGTSSVVMADAWDWEEAALRVDDGIHIHWPDMFTYHAETHRLKKNEDREKSLQELEKLFDDSRAYSETEQPVNLKLGAMKGLFDGSKTAYLHADYVKEMIEGIEFLKSHGVQKVVLAGGRDSWQIVDYLKKNDIAVILSRVHALPAREEDDVQLSKKIPTLLQKAGVLYCLSYTGDMGVMGSRNLPFTAGTTVVYGLEKEEALQSITLNAAKVLGIDSRTGSLETGKDATLFISAGDALNIQGNNIEAAFIEGRKINLDNKQKQLYKEYSIKYGLK